MGAGLGMCFFIHYFAFFVVLPLIIIKIFVGTIKLFYLCVMLTIKPIYYLCIIF